MKQTCKGLANGLLKQRHQSLFLFSILFLVKTSVAQIVPNASFEHHTCTGTFPTFSCLTSWISPNTIGMVPEPDYFFRGIYDLPFSGPMYQETHPSGELGYIGFQVSQSEYKLQHFHEYIQAPLNIPLTENKCYKVRFYVSWVLDTNNSVSYLKHIGAYFSRNPISSATYLARLPFTPQVVSNRWLNDTLNWMLIKGCIKVPGDSTYNHITLGNFESSPEHRDTALFSGYIFRSYYYLDDISVDSINSNFSYSKPICGEPVYFTSADPEDRHYWDFGDGDTSSNANPNHNYNGGGIYTVRHTIYIDSCNCSKTSVDTIKILNCCRCKDCNNSLVINGHFSDTCHAAYSTDFIAKPCPNAFTAPDEYTESTNANICNGDLWCGLDHTGTPGSKFLVVDGHFDFRPSPSPAELRAWYQKVGKVKTGHHYCFSAYVKNICKDCADKPSLKLQVEAKGRVYTVDAIKDLAYNDCCEAGWTKICGTWTAPENTDSVVLRIMIERGQWMGNDVGIDDISFGESCSDTFSYNDNNARLFPLEKEMDKAAEYSYVSSTMFPISACLLNNTLPSRFLKQPAIIELPDWKYNLIARTDEDNFIK